jgi:hypothetical protein
MRLRQSIGSRKKVKAGKVRYEIFAVSPVSDSSEAERRLSESRIIFRNFVIVSEAKELIRQQHGKQEVLRS